jgi:NAD(P)-dependent dehydrogenase (short-subunit alcohol dehydrogenase family)
MKRLEGKIALVTGGASVPGLGSATAIRFAQEGARVYVTDRDLDGAERWRNRSAMPAAGAALAHDVTSEADWDRVIAAIDAADGALDVVVNNAGIAVLGEFDKVTTADWLKQNDVNLNSVFQGTQRAFVMMRRPGADGRHAADRSSTSRRWPG